MELEQIIAEVQRVVHNSDYTEEIIESLVDEAVLAIATGVKIPGRNQLSPPLPDLYKSDEIQTVVGVGYCDLPEDYNRGVVMVLDSSGEPIKFIDSWLKFMKRYAKQDPGGVSVYAINGRRLYYRDIPTTAETLTVHYYGIPEDIECVPPTLHRDLIIGYVARAIFNEIELGLQGPKVDSTNYDNIFQGGILKLIDIIPEDGEPEYYENTTDYIG